MREEIVDYEIDITKEHNNVAELESWKVDKYLATVKENNEKLEQLEEILNKRVEDLKSQFEKKKKQIIKENHYLLTTLGQYAKSQDKLKSTKTQYKLQLLSGDIVIKKPIQKPKQPTKDNEKKLTALYPDLVEVETNEKFKWGQLKKKLTIQNGEVYDSETGENLTELIEIDTTEEEIIVK